MIEQASAEFDACAAQPGALARVLRKRMRFSAYHRGFTLLELMLGMAVMGILGVIGAAGYRAVMERVNNSRAATDITELQLVISKFNVGEGRLPDTLAEVGAAGRLDPWGRPYEYLNFTGLMGNGMMRKDRNLVPINSDFDLYSKGPDGVSLAALTALPSRDDIVRANDGRFVGKAEDY